MATQVNPGVGNPHHVAAALRHGFRVTRAVGVIGGGHVTVEWTDDAGREHATDIAPTPWDDPEWWRPTGEMPADEEQRAEVLTRAVEEYRAQQVAAYVAMWGAA